MPLDKVALRAAAGQSPSENPSRDPAPSPEPRATRPADAPDEHGDEISESRLELEEAAPRKASFPPLDKPRAHPQLSNQIHILGLDLRARYLAYLLGCSPGAPPARLLIHARTFWDQWAECGRRIRLHRDREYTTQDNVEVEWVGRSDEPPSKEHIQNLIISAPAVRTLRALEGIRHRIDHRTTICLLSDGMGIVDEINSAYFRDPLSRPTYFLGHMSQALRFGPDRYSVVEAHAGRLYLAAEFRDEARYPRLTFHPPVQTHERVRHFSRLLCAVPGLNAGGYSREQVLLKKLPVTVFKAVVDPITLILGCSYIHTLHNPFARMVMDDLLGEIGQVILQLPELRGSRAAADFVWHGKLRREVRSLIRRLGKAESSISEATQKGFESNIDYLTGYFVRRGMELGIKCPASKSLMWLVKSIHRARLSERRGEVPLRWSVPHI